MTTQTLRERVVLHAFLSDQQRNWLNTRPREMRTYDVTNEFIDTFDLEPSNAGRLLAQWVREAANERAKEPR